MSQLYMSKRGIHILISMVSLFSFVLVSYSTVFLPLLSTFSMTLITYSTDRNYIFLLFNGILVFLIKNSGFITNSSLVTDHIKNNHVNITLIDNSSPVSYHIKNNQVEKTRKINHQVPESSQVNPEVHTQQGEEEEEEEEETQRKENEILFTCADCESEEQTGQVLDIQKEDNESYADEEDERRQELNKRCEEFIRRMKQDIKTDRQPTRIN